MQHRPESGDRPFLRLQSRAAAWKNAVWGLLLVACNDLAGVSSLAPAVDGSHKPPTDSAGDDTIVDAAAPPCTAIVSAAGCPTKMVMVPGGCYSTYLTETRVSIDAFCLDPTEVTVSAYQDCATTGACPPAPTVVDLSPGDDESKHLAYDAACNANHPERVDDPINCIPWQSAFVFCTSHGKRLPANDEWEWAARGGERGTLYPWGSEDPKAQLCWSGLTFRGRTCAVGSFPAGDDPLGVHDLAGNVDEWTTQLELGTTDAYVVRGGNWNRSSRIQVGLLAQSSEVATNRKNGIGFRCAASP